MLIAHHDHSEILTVMANVILNNFRVPIAVIWGSHGSTGSANNGLPAPRAPYQRHSATVAHQGELHGAIHRLHRCHRYLHGVLHIFRQRAAHLDR